MNYIFDWDPKYKTAIIKCDNFSLIHEYFSIENKMAKFAKFKNRFIPKRKYCITQNGRFDIGLLDDILKYISSLQIPYNIIITDELKKRYNTKYDIGLYQLISLKESLRDYQKEACQKAIDKGCGVTIVGTGGGKTLIAATLIETLRKNNAANLTLMIVPTIQLVEQSYKDFIDYGVDPDILSKWSGDNILNPNAKIIIAGLSILQSEKTDLAILGKVDLLIIDEAHSIRRENISNNLFKNITTRHRFGMTGTLPESKLDEWNIIGKIGPITYEKKSHELQDEHYISTSKAVIIKIEYKNTPDYSKDKLFDDPTIMYEEELEFLYNQPFRNLLLSKICQKLDNNILVMVDRIKHGEELFKNISSFASNKKVYFIRGEVDIEEREKIRNLMEVENNIVCIAISKIFATGINIRNLHYIMFAASGKAKVRIIQSIGRGLRLHENKDQLVIYDIADDLIYGRKHFDRRMELYESEKIKTEIREIAEQ